MLAAIRYNSSAIRYIWAMVLVTGGTGLIGSHLLFELTKNGNKVRAIYRTETTKEKVKTVFSYYSNDVNKWFQKIEWVKADICDIPALERAFEDVDYVFHCAALITFDPAQYQDLLKINVEGTENIVNLCLAKKVKKLCYVSSIAALGTDYGNTVDEGTAWSDSDATVYGLTKRNAELTVWRASQEGLPVTIVNPGVVLGPGFWKSGSGTFFYYAAKGKRKTLPGGTGFISVHDVVHVIQQLMDSEIKNERFVLVDENATYLDILQRIAKCMDVRPPEKTFGFIEIAIFWRLDWLRAKLFGKRRRLAKNTAKSLYKRGYYSSKKIKDACQIQFEGIDGVISFCSQKFKAAYPKLF